MTPQNYTATFTVAQSPEQVFAAVTNPRGWWSEEIEGRTDTLGAEFEFHYKDLHRTTQKITELVPNQRVVWEVTESHIGFVADTNEWRGTKIVFEIARKGARTELRFTHVGLVPAMACYEDCSGAWGFYVNDSLRDLIATGSGNPNRKQQDP